MTRMFKVGPTGGWLGLVVVIALTMPSSVVAGQAGGETPTFSREVAPILQRSCQSCRRPNSVAPMSLLTYKEVSDIQGGTGGRFILHHAISLADTDL